MVRKPLLKNDNRTKLFFYDYLKTHTGITASVG